MIRYLRINSDQMRELTGPEPGCWVYVISPSPEELKLLSEQLDAPLDFLQAATDEEESARIDHEADCTLLVIDIPTVEAESAAFVYSTLPMGILLTSDCLVTICTRETPVLTDFLEQRIRGFSTAKRSRFILQILGRITNKFLAYLKQIDKASMRVENELHKSMKNKELFQMLKLEKSLVFFSTSLKGNEMILERMLRHEHIQKFPDDTELLEDVITENKQAMEMCGIYRDILSGTMDAFASIISNNLNIVMKILTSVTMVLAIPTLIVSIWGMNVSVPFQNSEHGFLIVMATAAILTVVAFFILLRKKMF